MVECEPERGQKTDIPKPGTLGVSRREFLHLAGLAAANAALSACSPPVSRTAAKSGDVLQLVYQDWRTDWFPPMVHEMLDEFHAFHPNIRVFFVPDPENFSEKMLADFQAGTAPDVFQGCCVHFPSWAQQGYTLDLRPYVEADLDQAVVDDWNPAQYESLSLADGHQFGLPKYHGALALYFNKDLFDEYGLDYPDDTWDHDDYLAAMVRLTHDRNGDGQTDLWGSMLDISWERIQVHVNGWGGHLVDPTDPTKCAMASPQAVAALEWLRARMWDDRVMATQQDVEYMEPRDAFSNGRVAMVEDGSWALKDILSRADFRVGVAPFPAGPERKVTLATTDGFGIYAGTRYPEAAWELLKFLVSKAYGRAMARANFLQPARASLVDDWVGYIREELPEKVGDMDLAAFAAGHIQGYSVTGEIFANMADAKRFAYDAWNQVLTQGKAFPGDMVDVCARIEASQVGEE